MGVGLKLRPEIKEAINTIADAIDERQMKLNAEGSAEQKEKIMEMASPCPESEKFFSAKETKSAKEIAAEILADDNVTPEEMARLYDLNKDGYYDFTDKMKISINDSVWNTSSNLLAVNSAIDVLKKFGLGPKDVPTNNPWAFDNCWPKKIESDK